MTSKEMYTVDDVICKNWGQKCACLRQQDDLEGYTGETEVKENIYISDEAQNEDNCSGKG